MSKYFYFLQLFLICLMLGCVWVTSASVPQTNNAYEAKKDTTVKHPYSTRKNEHGKWDLPYLRSIFAFIEKIAEILLTPLRFGTETIKDVGEVIIPSTKGLDTNSSFGVLVEDFKAKLQHISPGTKWCGPGNVAKSKNDIGTLADADSCCRNHDLCPKNIAAGDTKYGLKNSGLFTRSLCHCDGEFYNCLKKVNSPLTRDLGITYFNTLGPQCFEKVNCTDPKITCRNNQQSGTQYVWSDNPSY